MKRKYRLFLCMLLSVPVLLLSGCDLPSRLNFGKTSGSGESISKSGFYFNTVITVTLYGTKDETLLDDCFSLADTYENYFSNTIADSDVSKINTANGAPVTVHEETAELIKKGLYYGDLSNGKFDITIGKLSDLWDISTKALLEKTDASMIPSDDEIKETLKTVNYQNVVVDGNTVTLKDPSAKIDLGGIAKGYIADRMKDYLNKKGAACGYINLGGNVLCLGPKPDGSAYNIGIQRPFDEEGAAMLAVSVTDQTVVSSGVYERYFEVDGKRYHHILDTATGYPYDNGLLGVSIITDESVDGDGLSTTCFALGLDDGMALVESLDNTEAVFITDDYELHFSSGMGTKIPYQVME